MIFHNHALGDSMRDRHPVRAQRRYRPLLVVLSLLTLLVGLAFGASPARADDYSMDQTNIDATLDTSGGLTVTEVRAFDFDGDFHGVYWKIPKGENGTNGRTVSVQVLDAGIVEGGQARSFTESSAGANETYSITDYGSYLQIKLYSAQSDTTAHFYVSYYADGIATRWSDTGELYWKFVSDGWDVESQNVTCTIHLPVPSGESVVGGDNVRAWGHGPLDASLAFDGNDIVYTVPGVGSSEFAEARITFPASWISECPETSGEKLSSILAEEQKNADDANARRAAARAAMYGVTGICLAVAVAAIVAALIARRRYKATHTAKFDDKYFRDVPTGDHPVVLAMLATGEDPGPEGLTASLMRLTDEHVVQLDKVKLSKKKVLGSKEVEDYRASLVGPIPESALGTPAERESARHADVAAVNFLFRHLARKISRPNDPSYAGDEPALYFSVIKKYAKSAPEAYSDAYKSWQSSINAEYLRRFSGNGSLKGAGRGVAILLGSLSVLAAFLEVFVVGIMFEGDILLALGVAAICGACGALSLFLVSGKFFKDISASAIETKAKVLALKRWLQEFTRLDEAVPTDVILWNRLLVMAVALGVADKVIEQLKVVMPELLDDPSFMPVYSWYYMGHSGMGSPADVFGGAIHDASVAAIANSVDASGSGGGGGFSSGGGGGFGGGGGGGAF